jgi:HrpA-like RNA helicase
LKALGVTDALNFDFIQSPAPEQICEALVLLHMLGALDNLGNITDIGKMMSKLPLYPPVAKMVLSASGR